MERLVNNSWLLCIQLYFEDGVEVDKVLKSRPVEMDHLGVLPGLLGLRAFS